MKLTYAMIAALAVGLLLMGCQKEDAKGFPKVDYNKDGKIIFEELIVVFPDLTVDEFLAADADNNGSLDEKEYTRLRQARDAGKKLDAAAAAAAPAAAAKTPPVEPDKVTPPAKPAESAPPAAPAGQPAAPAAPDAQSAVPAAPAVTLPPAAPTAATPPAGEVVETVVAEAPAPAPAGQAAAPAAETYTVGRGDTLSRIAKKFGITAKELMAANGMKDADRIDAGRVLTIPGKGAAKSGASGESVSPAVAAFVADYFAKSGSGEITALVDLYGDSVDYYKKGRIGADVVRQDKTAYFERWPQRTYNAAPPTAAALPDGNIKVTVPVDYTVKRADKSARGQATFTLVLQPAGGSFRIVGEQSAVTERK
ncbi:LysM peptidoglycan-binding domain-containing protein [Desulfovibrio sp. TomC]|uniref:LysM peptidoglycan-binding domain-containing protein n=1 Tax=Desulfovibrio sp. TomC TaxID=1562888 RepID=UPI0005747E11|nr:LysM peptidoglycan-binding domain-containing protein [Desulfovibrio sp. TomC]KHK02691.1 Translation initiation factor 2 [Desulfovibrio sp. TomC]